MKRVLLTGADFTIVEPNGDTALHRAASRGNPEIIQSMLEHGACVDARTPSLCTPLMAAVMNVHCNENEQDSQLAIEKLIAASSDLNQVGETGNTALILAVAELCQVDTGSGILAVDSHVVSNCEMRRMNVSVSISLIEAGQTFCLYQMHWLEARAAGRCRPHDCKLRRHYSTTLCNTTRRRGDSAEHARTRSACRSANCKRRHCTSPCCQKAKEEHNAATAQSRCIRCCLALLM